MVIDEGQFNSDNNFEPLELSDGFVERIDKSNLKSLNDPTCTHRRLTRSEGDIPGTTDVHCEDCHVGWYER